MDPTWECTQTQKLTKAEKVKLFLEQSPMFQHFQSLFWSSILKNLINCKILWWKVEKMATTFKPYSILDPTWECTQNQKLAKAEKVKLFLEQTQMFQHFQNLFWSSILKNLINCNLVKILKKWPQLFTAIWSLFILDHSIP